MNRALESEVHPDAESLSAFMEQALPEPERARILEHVAVCSQCRQIVFLSQQAALEANAPAAVPAAGRARSWKLRLNWQWAWAPALALIVVVALVLRFSRPAEKTEVARATPPASALSPVPSTQEPVEETKANQPVPRASIKSAKKSVPPAEGRKSAGEFVVSSAYSGVGAGQAGGASADFLESAERAPEAIATGQGNLANASAPGPEPAVAAWEQEQRAASELANGARKARTTQARFNAGTADAQAGRSITPAAAPVMAARAAVSGGVVSAPSRSMAYGVLLPKAETAKLPSGLAAISIATEQDRALAIDSTGALFVRESSFANWKPVARQWTGRAVLVRVQRSPGGSPAADTAAEAAPQSAPPVFEIVNDSNLVWVSQDGETWKAQ